MRHVFLFLGVYSESKVCAGSSGAKIRWINFVPVVIEVKLLVLMENITLHSCLHP